MRSILIIAVLISCSTIFNKAQTPDDLIKQGKELLNKGSIYIDVGYLVEAEQHFQEALVLDEENYFAQYFLAYSDYRLAIYYMQNEDDEHRQGLIMAIGNEERELLTKFWDQNQKLILSALYAISSDPDQEKDVRDNIGFALKSISNNQKDRSLLSIYFNDQLCVEKIKKSDIGYRTVKLMEEKNLIDQAMFDFLRCDKSCSFRLLKLKEEATETEIKYKKYRLNTEPELVFDDAGYYVVRNWGINNIKKFITNMTTKIPQLRYEVHE